MFECLPRLRFLLTSSGTLAMNLCLCPPSESCSFLRYFLFISKLTEKFKGLPFFSERLDIDSLLSVSFPSIHYSFIDFYHVAICMSNTKGVSFNGRSTTLLLVKL